MDSNIPLLITAFVSGLIGYFLSIALKKQSKHQILSALITEHRINGKQIETEANLYKLHAQFAKDYNVYLPLKRYDYKLFKRAVTSKNKWKEWCQYESDVNNYFNGDIKAFFKARNNTIHAVSEYMRETFDKLSANVKKEISVENSDNVMQKLRNKFWQECANKKNYTNILKSLNIPAKSKLKKNYLTLENENEILLSIDLITANFQTMKFLHHDLVKNANNYEEFISHFTDVESVKKSKLIRQIILGKCKPKIQQYIQRCFMAIIVDEINHENIRYLSNDEVIYKLNTEDEEIKKQMDVITKYVDDIIVRKYGINCRIEIFKLKVLNRNRKWFVKEFVDEVNKGTIKLMKVPGKYYLRCYNHVFGREEDLLMDRTVEEANNEIKFMMDSINLQYTR